MSMLYVNQSKITGQKSYLQKNKNIVELIKENKNTVKYIILSPHWQNHN